MPALTDSAVGPTSLIARTKQPLAPQKLTTVDKLRDQIGSLHQELVGTSAGGKIPAGSYKFLKIHGWPLPMQSLHRPPELRATGNSRDPLMGWFCARRKEPPHACTNSRPREKRCAVVSSLNSHEPVPCFPMRKLPRFTIGTDPVRHAFGAFHDAEMSRTPCANDESALLIATRRRLHANLGHLSPNAHIQETRII